MRRRSVVAALVLVALLITVPFTAAAVPDARLTVSGLTVTPDAPVTGEPVTVTATVAASAGSQSPVTIEQVQLRQTDGTVLERADRPGALSAGGSLTVDLVTSFDAAGQQDLEIVVVGTDENGNTTRAVRPFTVVIERAPPTLEVAIDDPVAGVETPVAVTVSNPTTTVRRNLELTLTGADGGRERAVVPTLPAGSSTTVNLSVRPEAGDGQVVVSLAYTTSTGHRAVTERAVDYRAEQLRADVGVAVRRAPAEQPQQQAISGLSGLVGGAGGGQTLQADEDDGGRPEAAVVEVTNFGNVPIREVVVRPRVGDRSLPRRAVEPLAPGESATIEVDLSGVDGATLTAVVDFRYAGARTGSATGTYEYDPPAGEMAVTDVNLEFTEDGRLRVTGNAGNVGDGEVTGVVVRIGANEHIRPAYPGRTYFVGTVAASEFAPFELTAEVDAENATEIPVSVVYQTDGDQRVENVTLPYDSSLAPDSDRQSALPVSLSGAGVVAGLAVGLVVALSIAYLVRRQ